MAVSLWVPLNEGIETDVSTWSSRQERREKADIPLGMNYKKSNVLLQTSLPNFRPTYFVVLPPSSEVQPIQPGRDSLPFFQKALGCFCRDH